MTPPPPHTHSNMIQGHVSMPEDSYYVTKEVKLLFMYKLLVVAL